MLSLMLLEVDLITTSALIERRFLPFETEDSHCNVGPLIFLFYSKTIVHGKDVSWRNIS